MNDERETHRTLRTVSIQAHPSPPLEPILLGGGATNVRVQLYTVHVQLYEGTCTCTCTSVTVHALDKTQMAIKGVERTCTVLRPLSPELA